MFWSTWQPATMVFCERELDFIIRQPANTWTNIAYIFISLFIIKKYWQNFFSLNKILLLFPISAFFVGITSGLYHASGTFFFQVFDLSSMFLLSSLLLILNTIRLLRLEKKIIYWILYILLVIFSFYVLMIIRGKIGEYIFGISLVLSIILELILLFKEKKNQTGKKIKYYFFALGFFIIAYMFWLLDYYRIYCNPDNHIINGHGLWHILNSFCFIFLFKFYSNMKIFNLKIDRDYNETTSHI